jgi:hypothetical protein
MEESHPPRFLVEGGPVDRRTRHILAILVGLMIGVGSVLGWVAVEALHASRNAHFAIEQVKASRIEATRRTCLESNEHHATAKLGIEALARKITPEASSPAAALQNREILYEFVEAIAPHYDCAVRVRELTAPHVRMRQPSQPGGR